MTYLVSNQMNLLYAAIKMRLRHGKWLVRLGSISCSIQRNGDDVIFSKDEGIKPDTTNESLANLRPVFNKAGQVTAGIALNDGASAVLIASESLPRKRLGYYRYH